MTISLSLMAKSGLYTHEFYVGESLNYLKAQGFRVVNLKNRTADGIAISKYGRVIALEIVAYSKRGNDLEIRAKNKVSDYLDLGFDNVFALTIDKYDSCKTVWSSIYTDKEQEIIDKIMDAAPKMAEKLPIQRYLQSA